MTLAWPALLALFLVAALFTAVWARALRTRDAGVIDIFWGPGFVIVAWVWAWANGVGNLATLLLLACVTLWGARLGLHLWLRSRGATAEDARYAAMRAADPDGFPRKSLVKVFLLQAVILWVLALPIHLTFGLQDAGRPASPTLLGLGLSVFLVGFVIEAVADWQLLRFKRDPSNQGRLLTTGLRAWSRHPNYFGEALLWFGLGLVAFAGTGSLLVFIGPALLTFLLLKVSGVSLLGAHLAATRPDFADYARRTSAFVPWPPRA